MKDYEIRSLARDAGAPESVLKAGIETWKGWIADVKSGKIDPKVPVVSPEDAKLASIYNEGKERGSDWALSHVNYSWAETAEVASDINPYRSTEARNKYFDGFIAGASETKSGVERIQQVLSH